MFVKVKEIIFKLIFLNGALSVEAYWNLCLSHPEYGYYITRDPLGGAGDFITAPEISQMFGEMIGIRFAEAWMTFGRPPKIYLTECGPGRGTLTADILRIARMVPDFADAIEVHFIETSPVLRAKQKEVLNGMTVTWHDTLDTVPDDAPLFVIANEFLDALPVRQYVMKDDEWFERMVGTDGNELVFCLSRHPTILPLPSGERGGVRGEIIFENSPARENFMSSLSRRLKAQSGIALMIDYGHDETRFGDTFQAVKNHAYADVLKDCGHCDLTSHVDFGRLKTLAENEGLSVTLEGQGEFLRRMGIEARAAQLAQKTNGIPEALHRLTDAEQMGTLFRVMEITA